MIDLTPAEAVLFRLHASHLTAHDAWLIAESVFFDGPRAGALEFGWIVVVGGPVEVGKGYSSGFKSLYRAAQRRGGKLLLFDRHAPVIAGLPTHDWTQPERDYDAPYRDDDCDERACDRCGTRYRGPGVYCCRRCALADAGAVNREFASMDGVTISTSGGTITPRKNEWLTSEEWGQLVQQVCIDCGARDRLVWGPRALGILTNVACAACGAEFTVSEIGAMSCRKSASGQPDRKRLQQVFGITLPD